jgi:hypothetical protein
MKLLQPDPIHIKLHEGWKYVNSGKTDISKTFKRERERLALLKQKPAKVRELRMNNGK